MKVEADIQQKVFSWMENAANQIGDFASKEVPPFIHEYLAWKFAENMIPIIFYVLICVLILILAIKFSKSFFVKTFEMDREEYGRTCFVAIPIVVHFFIVFMLCVGFPYQSLLNVVQIKVAPKVYLVERATEILKSK